MTTPRARKWGPNTHKQFRLPDELVRDLEITAIQRGLSTNDVVVHAIRAEVDYPEAWLDRLRLLPNHRKVDLLNALIDTIANEMENPE